jgi:hypothetical protein
MQPAAIGIRAHSGWGAVVVVSRNHAAPVLVDRKRIAVTDPSVRGANQPYHYAQGQKLSDAEQYLVDCSTISEKLAFEALEGIVEDMRRREYVPMGCAILLASGRSLPPVAKILASHPLIHTAEGEFFRQAFRRAGERLKIQVTGIRERELDARAAAVFGARSTKLKREIAALGATVGPPWTTDQKLASLAALLVLESAGMEGKSQSGKIR